MSADDDDLICPITQERFRDPVIAEDGHVYEREAITQWINAKGTSPLTRQPLSVDRLQPDDEVRRRADERRRLSVTSNQESDRVKSPTTTNTLTIVVPLRDLPEPTTRHAYCQNVPCRCASIDILGDRCCESACDTCFSCCESTCDTCASCGESIFETCFSCCESTRDTCCSGRLCRTLREPHHLVCICMILSVFIPLIIVLILFGIKQRA